MKHLLIEPASRTIMGQRLQGEVDDKAHAWIVELGANGKLEESLDPSFFEGPAEEDSNSEDIVDAMIDAAAEQHVAQTRLW